MPWSLRASTLVLLIMAAVLWLMAGIGFWRWPLAVENLPRLDTGLRIDIQTADAAALCVLPGIGPGLAHRIIAKRQLLGGFRSVDDLRDVRGIGTLTLERLGPYIRCSTFTAAGAADDGSR